jgi:hypothetical protein
VEEVILDIDGVLESNYLITPAGISAIQAYIAAKGSLPVVRDRSTCTNDQYRED